MKNMLIVAFLIITQDTIAQYNSLLWRISGKGLHQYSYLYGTMHTSDERVFMFGDSVLPAFQRMEVYAMEIDPDQIMDMSLLSEMTMGRGKSLKELLTESDYMLLDSTIHVTTGLPLALLDNIAPIVISALLEETSIGLKADTTGTRAPLDLWFHQQSKEGKKKIIGIETAKEQLRALGALSYVEQAELLVEQLHDMQRGEAEQDLLKFYIAGQLDSLAKYSTEEEMTEKFRKALLTDRNVRMATRIEKLVLGKPTFIAIGAMHLPFADGVIELLRKRGFHVEPVY